MATLSMIMVLSVRKMMPLEDEPTGRCGAPAVVIGRSDGSSSCCDGGEVFGRSRPKGMLTVSAALSRDIAASVATVISPGPYDRSESDTHMPLTISVGADVSPLIRLSILRLASFVARDRSCRICTPRVPYVLALSGTCRTQEKTSLSIQACDRKVGSAIIMLGRSRKIFAVVPSYSEVRRAISCCCSTAADVCPLT